METKKIVVLGTGGTIAGKAAAAGDNIGYVAGQVGVQDLLAAGADPHIADAEGITPLQHARQRGYGQIEALLLQAGAKR